MNRKTKGALAVGAGAILLLGGAGSYALWSDESPVGGDAITTGDLQLNCGAGGSWTDVSPDGVVGGPAVDPATDLMVPGDWWKYANTCTVVATGKNMHAQISVDTASVPGSTITDPACGGDCVTFDNTAAIGAGTPVSTPVTVNNGDSVAVGVVVKFNRDTPNRVGVNTTLNVNGMKVVLNQVRP